MIFLVYEYNELQTPIDGTPYLFRDSFGNPFDIRLGVGTRGGVLSIQMIGEGEVTNIRPDQYIEKVELIERSKNRDRIINQLLDDIHSI